MGRSIISVVGLVLITMSTTYLTGALRLIKDDNMAMVLLAYGIFGLILARAIFLESKK
jgi:hypothetical protein